MLASSPLGGDLLARRYRLIDRVGAGGMSVVWRARDEVLDRLVAVKWLDRELAEDHLLRDLVRREAWATARIKHPAVANVYDYGELDDADGHSHAYVVMEMLDGDSLSARLRRGPLPWREAVAICAEVADALASAHEQGVVHRDVSPDNVMLTTSGLRVFDFGIAASIGEPDDDATGSTFGTPAYVAPERLDGQPAQTATDVYSLGVLLFEMLTAAPPFPEDTWNPDAALRDRPAPRLRGVPGLPSAVARICQRCLAHDPTLRPTAREIADRLARYAGPRWRGRLALAAAAVVVLAVVVGVTVALTISASPARPARPGGAAPEPSTVVSTGTGAPSAVAQAPTASVPVVQPPASITVQQALDDVRAVITAGEAQAQIRSDVVQDLRNQVEAIAAKRATDPTASVSQMVDAMRTNVAVRATQPWGGAASSPQCPPTGCMAISASSRDALLHAIDVLRGSLS